MRLYSSMIVVVRLALLAFFAIPFCAASAEETYDPLKVKGALQEAAAPLKKLIKFRWKDGKIQPDLVADRETAQGLIHELTQVAGSGGSGSSSGGNEWSFNFNARSLNGEYKYHGPLLIGAGTHSAKFKEVAGAKRELSVQSRSNGQLSISIQGGDDPYLLRMHQDPGGSLIVQEISGEQVFSHGANSFAEFCRTHVSFARDRLIPVLAHVGIDPPTTPYDQRVREEVVRLLKPLSKEQLEKFKDIGEGLDSEEFAVREKTAARVAEQFKDWEPVIRRVALDTSNSAEVRSRLFLIIRDKSSEEDQRIHDIITKTKLTSEPDYLVWLLTETKSAEDRPFVVSALEKVSGQEFGDDEAAWQKWLAAESSKRPQPADVNLPAVDLLAEKGRLQDIAAHTARMVKFTWDEDRMRLDREQWAKPFGGKTIKELSDEIAAEVKKRNLPPMWWNRVQQEDSLGYPVVLFAVMQNELEEAGGVIRRHYHYGYGAHGGNSSFEIDALRATLTTEPRSERRLVIPLPDFGGAKKHEYFKLELQETAGPERSLSVEEDEKGRLQIGLVGEQAHWVVRLMELPSGAWIVQDVRGTQVFAAKADSFRQLHDKHKQYFNEQFFPLLKHVGIAIPDEPE